MIRTLRLCLGNPGKGSRTLPRWYAASKARRLPTRISVMGLLSVVALAVVSGLAPGGALAQTQPRPPVKGRYKVKIDSSPQQAAVYWDSSPDQQPKQYGIAGYTPIT